MPETLDNILLGNTRLAGPAQEELARKAYVEQKAEDRQARLQAQSDAEEEMAMAMEGEDNLRRSQASARAIAMKQKAKEKASSDSGTPMSMGTSRLLRAYWFALIPSWGLTLILINIHVYLHWVFGPKLFCKLGDEWIPKKVQSMGGAEGKMAGRALGIVEIIILLILDIAAIFIILSALGIISIIVQFYMMSWWDKLKTIWGLGWESVKAIYYLFYPE
jgi:hypothetical protein